MHMTISGRLGSGKSTVAHYLSDSYGFEIYSTGTVQREMAKQMNLTTLEMNELMKKDTHFDFMIDDAVTKLSIDRKDERLLFDSRMAWHFAKNSFRVFVTVDPQIAGNRCSLDRHSSVENYTSAEDARDQLLLRSQVENARFKEIYHVDNLDYHNFDLVVDSSMASPEEVGQLIYQEYEAFCSSPVSYEKKIFLAPLSIYPATASFTDKGTFPISVFCFGGYHYAASSYGNVLDAVREQKRFISCSLSGMPVQAEEILRSIGHDGINRLEKEYDFTFPSIPTSFA